MTSLLALKIKTKNGQFILKKENLKLSSTLSDLKSELSQLTQINSNQIEIRCGFPPCVIKSENNKEIIENLGIKNGDTLIVEENKSLEPANASRENEEAARVGNHVEENVKFVQPSPLPQQPQQDQTETNEVKKGGVLLRRTVPSDNSCLFTSIGFTLNGKVDTSAGSFMRQIISESIANDKDQYSDAILGKPNEDYVKWILKPDSWGGAIELSILSTVYGIEIAVIDTINQIINRFGEDQSFPHRVYLIFDGIHYDPLYWDPLDSSGEIRTIFPSDDEDIYRDAERLSQEAKQSKQYTDVGKFKLKCLDCNQILTGQSEATQHAKSRGHTNFDECNS